MKRMKKTMCLLVVVMMMMGAMAPVSMAANMEGPIGSIELFPYGFVPKGWLPCDGRVIKKDDSPGLCLLLGNLYGGDGVDTFGLPNLQKNAPYHMQYGINASGFIGSNGVKSKIGTIKLYPLKYEEMNQLENFKRCNSDQLDAVEYEALYSLIGSYYGGDSTNFNVPNLSAYEIDGYGYYICVDGEYPRDRLVADDYLGSVVMYAGLNGHSIYDAKITKGSVLNIAENSVLYSFIGTQFGGNGNTNFRLPNMSKMTPVDGVNYYILMTGIKPSRD